MTEWYATIIKELSIKKRCALGKTYLIAFLFDLNRKILNTLLHKSFYPQITSTYVFKAYMHT